MGAMTSDRPGDRRDRRPDRFRARLPDLRRPGGTAWRSRTWGWRTSSRPCPTPCSTASTDHRPGAGEPRRQPARRPTRPGRVLLGPDPLPGLDRHVPSWRPGAGDLRARRWSCGRWSTTAACGGPELRGRTQWVITVLLPTLARRWPGASRGAAAKAGGPDCSWPASSPSLFRLIDLDAVADDTGLRAVYLAFVLHVVPTVLAGLACWWLEVATGTHEARPVDPASATSRRSSRYAARSRRASCPVSCPPAPGCRPCARSPTSVGLAVNTVARVYRELESDGVIVTSGRRGHLRQPHRSGLPDPTCGRHDGVRRHRAPRAARPYRGQRLVEEQWPR